MIWTVGLTSLVLHAQLLQRSNTIRTAWKARQAQQTHAQPSSSSYGNHAPPPPHAMHEPPFPQGQPLGGQTFASTLLLSFSCAPLLKQHLLRTLSMTNEELASLEPIIAQAWDHWDQQVRTRVISALCFV